MDEKKQKLIKLKNVFYQKYWPDPVWSKVISAGIIAILSGILTAIYVLFKSSYDKVSIKSAAIQTINYLKSTTEINNLIFWASLLVIAWTFYSFLKLFLKEIAIKIKEKAVFIDRFDVPKEFPTITEHSTVFFSNRLAKAFPGQRGLMWYEPKTAVKRFKILFQEPLQFKSEGHYGVMSDPIWWFREGSAMFIDRFKALSNTKVLMGWDELELKRVAVYISNAYYKSYIYVETKGEKQTGLYNFESDDIKRHIDTFGYSREEYGLLRKKPIRREQYDDGATIIKNKVVDATSADLRVRYLSGYNFIIAAKQSPYNSHKFQRESKEYLNDILQSKQTTERFFEFLETFENRDDL
jgi:hypothetical protein